MGSTVISKVLSREELKAIASRLEKYDAVFSQLWGISYCEFDSIIPTAAVSFDDVGQVVTLYINPKFWKACSSTKQDFVICHEMLHVILEHGRRAVQAESINQATINTCMDVVVNELLVSGFGFNRKDVDPKNELCWQDVVFPKLKDNPFDKTFEYYLNQLPKTGGGSGKGKVLDDHSRLGTGSTDGLAEKVASKLSPEEKENFTDKLGEEGKQAQKGGQQAGSEAGGFVKVMATAHVARKRKWESLIKTCLKKIAGEGLEESWLSAAARRVATLAGSKILLPVEIEGEGIDHHRALVFMFLDTSGSCADLAPRFWRLACSVPKDVFDLRLYCFDTKVYKIDLKKKKLYGFGGTRFDIMERKIQEEIKESGRYPDGVFVLTDGFGNAVNPQKPEKWHVLLTGGYRHYFSKEVNCYPLSKFE